ncbi:hypothetical protein FNV43_RR20425 [Rhamnella rubrinervis]|uniref:Uncharacterized protein n=1 Tax=Rhamnella rubrinervis TaxID=2594499 RepID=A0A8K0E0N7_9ROSA|nr:hypothetical protein FNV43_RR20425 [Rhamnella rubrinervis]
MRSSKESKRRSRPSSPLRDRTRVPSGFEPRSPGSRSSVSVLDREELLDENIAVLEGLSISSDLSNSNLNPRSFLYSVASVMTMITFYLTLREDKALYISGRTKHTGKLSNFAGPWKSH